MPPKRTADADQTPLSQEEKLKEQNRAHQKLFRERRKEKMKLLEERVAELERELQLVRSTTANSNSDALNQAELSFSLEFDVAPNQNQSRRTSEPFIVPTSPNDTPFSVDPATHARLMSLEAENFALKAMLAQQQQQLHLQSYLATLPPQQPSPHSTGAASSSTGHYYANPYTAVAPPPQQDQSWRDLINLEEEEDQQPEHTTPIQPPPPLTQALLQPPPPKLRTPPSTSLSEIVSAANQMLLDTPLPLLTSPDCTTANHKLLSIPSLSTRTDLIQETCTSFTDLCLYAVSLAKTEGSTPDATIQGKLLLDFTMNSYHVYDACRHGEERGRALDVLSDLRFGERNRRFKILVAKQLPSLFLVDTDPIGLSQLPLPLIQQETEVFYKQCMQIPSLRENSFIGRVFDGAKSLLTNQDSTHPDDEAVLQSRCFWYQYYMHVLIPLLCPTPDRLRLEHLVDRGRIERKAAFDDLVETLDSLELK